MRLLVTADVHLANDHPERQAALGDVIRIAEEEHVHVLLIAGDLFDAGVDIEALKAGLRDRFTENEFQTFVIPGNHDANAFRAEDHFGDDIAVLSSQPFEQVDLGAVNLVGVPYIADGFSSLVSDLRKAWHADKLNLLLLHGTLSTSTGPVFGEESRYLPFTPEELLETGYEYVFAGHIHSSPTKRTFGDDACVFAYPGSPVSITTKETNRRGVWLFDTEEGELRERPVDSFHYVREAFDLSPGEGPEKLEQLDSRLAGRNLEHATLLVEPAGYIEMNEGEFFQRLTEVVEDAGAAAFEIDRSNVESARTILDSTLYQQFEAKLAQRDDIDTRAVRRIALKALSAEERA